MWWDGWRVYWTALHHHWKEWYGMSFIQHMYRPIFQYKYYILKHHTVFQFRENSFCIHQTFSSLPEWGKKPKNELQNNSVSKDFQCTKLLSLYNFYFCYHYIISSAESFPILCPLPQLPALHSGLCELEWPESWSQLQTLKTDLYTFPDWFRKYNSVI